MTSLKVWDDWSRQCDPTLDLHQQISERSTLSDTWLASRWCLQWRIINDWSRVPVLSLRRSEKVTMTLTCAAVFVHGCLGMCRIFVVASRQIFFSLREPIRGQRVHVSHFQHQRSENPNGNQNLVCSDIQRPSVPPSSCFYLRSNPSMHLSHS